MDEGRLLRGGGFSLLQRHLTAFAVELARQAPDLLRS
jgi:hypothetical protein